MTVFAAIRCFARDESGAVAIEYSLIGALIAMALFATFALTGDGIGALFGSMSDRAGNSLNSASGSL